jgi:hypothetical protein
MNMPSAVAFPSPTATTVVKVISSNICMKRMPTQLEVNIRKQAEDGNVRVQGDVEKLKPQYCLFLSSDIKGYSNYFITRVSLTRMKQENAKYA